MHDVLQLEGHDILCQMLCKNPSMQLIRNLYCLKPFSIFQLMIYNRRSKKIKDFYVTIYLFLHKFVSFRVLGLIGKTMTGLRGGSRTASTSKMELFVIIVNGFQPLTIITKSSTLDVAAVLDPPLGLQFS